MLEVAKSWWKRFYDPDMTMYASSLSFNTIFAIVPLLLVFFSIFIRLPSFESYSAKLKNFIFSHLIPAHQETITHYIDTFMKNSSKMGVMGFVFVLFASIMFFQNYEYIVNKIFKSKPRSFWDSITTYWTLMTLAPIGLAFSFYLSSKIQALLNSSHYTDWIDFLSIFPYLIIWLIFFITYKISATAWIHPKAAMVSSFVSSLVWDVSKNLFVYYVVYNKTYTTLYGSFSAILFFLLWIYISWIIFLYGLRLCYLINQEYTKGAICRIECQGTPDSEQRGQEIEPKEP